MDYHVVNFAFLLYDTNMVGDILKRILENYETVAGAGAGGVADARGAGAAPGADADAGGDAGAGAGAGVALDAGAGGGSGAGVALDAGSGLPCVCVHGERGTGKTALLEKVKNTLLMSGANVYFAIGGDEGRGTEGLPKSDDAIRELLRQLVRMYGQNHDPNFISFVLSYAKGTLAADYGKDGALPYDKPSIINFVYGCLKTEPLVFVVDDLDKADAFTIRLIDNLLSQGALQFLVFSHTDRLESKALSDMLYRNTKRINYVQLKGGGAVARTNHPPPVGGTLAGRASASPTEGKDEGRGRVPYEGRDEGREPVLDDAALVLSRPGMEQQLIRHIMKNAEQLTMQMAYERAAETLAGAVDVCDKLVDDLTVPDELVGSSPRNTLNSTRVMGTSIRDALATQIDLLTKLGDAQVLDGHFRAAADSYSRAFQVTMGDGIFDGSPVPKAPDLSETRASLSIKLADCYSRLYMPDKAREYVMLAEAFFSTPERRAEFYGLYIKHIPKYLYLLAELDERVIFREKLKQAYLVCPLDDKEFTASLYCEEGHMCMMSGDFEKAYELFDDARSSADEFGFSRLWDEATNSLAICCEHMEKPELSRLLWNELLKRSYDPVKRAKAMVNLAVMCFEQDEDADKAVLDIQAGIDLCVLVGEDAIASEIRENLRDTPLELGIPRTNHPALRSHPR